MAAHGYKFYIKEVDKLGNELLGTEKDLEADFDGLKYSALTGVDSVGAAKNVYEEKYADAHRLRVYAPTKVCNEATTMTLTLYFFGENRSVVFKNFCDYIRIGFHRYTDTARNRWFDFYIKDEFAVSDEMWYGGKPYFKAEVKMYNIFGRTFSSESELETAYGSDNK